MKAISNRIKSLGKTKATKVAKEAVDFQSDGLAIELESLPLMARSVLLIVLLVIVVAIIWAWYTEIDRVAVAQGRLITQEPLIVLHPLEKSVIREFKVRVGDEVKAGDPVALLDPTFASADLTASRSELGSLVARMARLEAEINDFSSIPEELDIPVEDRKAQTRILAVRKREYQSRLDLLSAKTQRLESQLKGAKHKKKIVLKRQGVVNRMLAMEQNLSKKEIGYKDKLLSALDEQLKVKQELSELDNKAADLSEEVLILKSEREAFIAQWWREVNEKLEQSKRRRFQLENDLAKAKRRTSLVQLRSPVDGIVLYRAQLSVGSVAQSAHPLVTLVPNSATLEGDVEISSKDIAMLDEGNEVMIKLEAFPFQKYGTLSGKITSIAPSSRQRKEEENNDKEQPLTYRAIIQLMGEKLSGLDKDIRLLPGMVITAEIIVGKRTVLSYFLYPIIRKLDETAKEPN